MALVDPVEREAMFFAVLRERVAPVEVLRPSEDDVRRRLREADDLICEWLDEAEAEGAAILERARAEAAQVRLAAAQEAAQVLAGVRALQSAVAALPPAPESGPRRPRWWRRG